MITEIRPNLYLGGAEVDSDLLRNYGITSVIIVADNLAALPDHDGVKYIKIGLRKDRMNSPAVKDLACHIPKYLTQNGEKVLVVSETGLERAAYVVCRVICETEAKNIYEVMQELKEKIPEYDITKSYF